MRCQQTHQHVMQHMTRLSPLTSFRNVLCVSSSKRINSFITITSPVSLWVTCYRTVTSQWATNRKVIHKAATNGSTPASASDFKTATFWTKSVWLHTFSKVMMHVVFTGRYASMLCLTLMACPKQPFPSTSPWMRSDGRKMRCVRLDTTRSDSDRLMSFLWEMGEAALLEPGDLSML